MTRESSKSYYDRLAAEAKDRERAAQAGYAAARLPRPGMFQATVALPLFDDYSNAMNPNRLEHTEDRDRFKMLAQAFLRAKKVLTGTDEVVNRISTTFGPAGYSLPWRHWQSQGKAAQKGKACQKLSDEERDWLDVAVTWAVREYDGEGYTMTRRSGRVWALHPRRGMVWVWTGDGFAEAYIEVLTRVESGGPAWAAAWPTASPWRSCSGSSSSSCFG